MVNREYLFELLEKHGDRHGDTLFGETQLNLYKEGYLSPCENEVVLAAIVLARYFHRDQRDKGGSPYFGHCHRVAKVFDAQRLPFALVACAYLHDIVEDTPVDTYDLDEIFGRKIASTVGELTNRKEDGDYQSFINGIQSIWAIQIKIADLLDNLNLLRIFSFAPKDINRAQKYADALITLYKRLNEAQANENPF